MFQFSSFVKVNLKRWGIFPYFLFCDTAVGYRRATGAVGLGRANEGASLFAIVFSARFEVKSFAGMTIH